MELLVDFLHHLNHWHWLCFSGFLFVLELLSGTTFCLWLGCAGAICACCTYWFDLSYNTQMIIFGVLSVVSLVLTWQMKGKPKNEIDVSGKGHNLIDNEYTLKEEMLFGGKIRIDGTLWSYDCPTLLKKGERFKITGLNGNQLLVEKT